MVYEMSAVFSQCMLVNIFHFFTNVSFGRFSHVFYISENELIAKRRGLGIIFPCRNGDVSRYVSLIVI